MTLPCARTESPYHVSIESILPVEIVTQSEIAPLA